MPVLPASLFEPLWVQFAALLPERPRVVPSHPVGCHRKRVADRLVFEHVIATLAHGSGYERIGSPCCSDRTMRRRLDEWASLGLAEQVHHTALEAYERMIGLDLAVDVCITKAPAGGEVAGRSPVDRGKQGLMGSVQTEGAGVPLYVVPAGANRHDAPVLAPTLVGLVQVTALTDIEPGTLHLDQGYAGRRTRMLLDELWLDGVIARKGMPVPRQAGFRWTVERTHSWMNGYGELRRCAACRCSIVEFYLFLATARIVLRCLIQVVRAAP